MATNLSQILRLEVPLVVLLAERSMTVSEVLALAPGSIIELGKPADAEIELHVNNKRIAIGAAVKVSENFGIRLNRIGSVSQRIHALGDSASAEPSPAEVESGMSAEQLAEALLAGQT